MNDSIRTTLVYFALECLGGTKSEFWHKPDKSRLLVDDNGHPVLRFYAYWHCCPQCRRTTPQMMGMNMLCSCGCVSAGQDRSVVLDLTGIDDHRTLFGRLSQAVRGIMSAHPAEFSERETIIRLSEWKGERP